MRLAVGSFTPSVVLAVAGATGRLEAEDLQVTEVPVPSSPAQFRGLLAGELDVALTSPDNVVAYRFVPDNPLATTADARIVSAVDRGLGLGLYVRPGLRPTDLRGGRVGVDVPNSGFALALYALAEHLGVGRDEYELVALGSTPKRLEALLAGDCDATMLNAGNELVAEDAGALCLAGVADVCGPYLGTVVAVVGETRLAAARRLGRALREAADAIVRGEAADLAAEHAARLLGISPALAARYVERLGDADEGLVVEERRSDEGLRTVVDLRRRYLPATVGGADVLAGALAPDSGLIDPGDAPS